MSSCNNYALAGLPKPCEINKGGVLEVYIANFDDVTGVTVDNTANTITSISLASGASIYRYGIRKNTAHFESTLNISDEGGNYISTELYLQFSKMETRKRMEMRALSVNEMVVIVKDANGIYWYLGKDEGVVASNGQGQTGTNRDDSNNYNITLTDTSDEFPYEVSEDAMTALAGHIVYPIV